MKNFLLIILLMVSSFINAQTNESKDIAVGVGLMYGTNNNMHVEMDLSILRHKNHGVNILVGGAIQMNTGIVGKDYSKVMDFNEFSEDIYEQGTTDTGSIYFGLGYTYKRFTLGGKVGASFESYYQNRYDSHHILTNSGKYSLSSSSVDEITLGGYFAYQPCKNIAITTSYDTYSKASFGLKYIF